MNFNDRIIKFDKIMDFIFFFFVFVLVIENMEIFLIKFILYFIEIKINIIVYSFSLYQNI